jgi:hypothetical protein
MLTRLVCKKHSHFSHPTRCVRQPEAWVASVCVCGGARPPFGYGTNGLNARSKPYAASKPLSSPPQTQKIYKTRQKSFLNTFACFRSRQGGSAAEPQRPDPVTKVRLSSHRIYGELSRADAGRSDRKSRASVPLAERLRQLGQLTCLFGPPGPLHGQFQLALHYERAGAEYRCRFAIGKSTGTASNYVFRHKFNLRRCAHPRWIGRRS